MEKQRNTRFRKNLYDPDRPSRRKPAPRNFEKNKDWIQVTDVETFKQIWPPFLHQKIGDYIEDWFLMVHKMDPAFTVGKFAAIRDNFMEQCSQDMLPVFFEVGITKQDIPSLTIYELIDLATKHLGFIIDIDVFNAKVLVSRPEVTLKGIDSTGNAAREQSRDDLRKVCKTMELSTNGTKQDLKDRIATKLAKKE